MIFLTCWQSYSFFPLELAFGFLSKSSAALTEGVTGVGGAELFDFVGQMTAPVVDSLVQLMLNSGVLVLILGVLLLFLSLRYLVVLLRSLFLGRSERLINKYLFGPAPIALIFGTLVTIMVQSSSITTSITVPLVGAGIVTVAQIFSLRVGCKYRHDHHCVACRSRSGKWRRYTRDRCSTGSPCSSNLQLLRRAHFSSG